MRESATYQSILEEGREEGQIQEARKILVELGTDRFGEPDAATVAMLDSLHDLDALHRLIRSVHRASSWQELLSTLPGR